VSYDRTSQVAASASAPACHRTARTSGTPTDPSDDEVIDSEMVKVTGWVFAEGRDFCTDVHALTS
jgi:hypothetical protein